MEAIQETSGQKVRAKPGQYLAFTLKSQLYGVQIETVREINRVTEITPVPQTPAFVAGVMSLRGKVIPVVDLRLKFGIEASTHTKQTCIIVIEGECGPIGIIVDSVSSVIDLAAGQLEPTPVMGDEDKLSFVIGMGKSDRNVIILVDIVQALSKEEILKGPLRAPEKVVA